MTVLTRFAPSPTGLLHVGNIRTAIVNWLFTKKAGGQFMLRIDDTDLQRSQEIYTKAIERDLTWLGLSWDTYAKQSERLKRYEEVKAQLLAQGRLYPCFETPEELELKRKLQLSRGVPPIYDRASLNLSEAKKQAYLAEGRKPHYRFLLKDAPIEWHDLVRGDTHFEGKHLSDPILIREDGSMTYILSSVVDDYDFHITHIIRGEDHVSNTAIQIQIFEALNATPPTFAHLALLKTKDAEISKRLGGFDIASLRDEMHLESLTIVSLLAKIGTSETPEIRTTLQSLIDEFDISKFGRAPANYDVEELRRLNQKLMRLLPFDHVKEPLIALGITHPDPQFWETVQGNITTLQEAKEWWHICRETLSPVIEDTALLTLAEQLLPEGEWDQSTWDQWIQSVKQASNKQGKALFMPIRLALTGQAHGPELRTLLPMIGKSRASQRLRGQAA